MNTIQLESNYPESKDPGVTEFLQNRYKKSKDFFEPDVPKNKGEVNEFRVRLIPNPHEALMTILIRAKHFDLGDQQGIVCPLRSLNKPCAICEFIDEQQKTLKVLCAKHGISKPDFKRPTSNTPSRVEQLEEVNKVWLSYKDLYAKRRGYISLIVRGEEAEGVKFWSVGAKVLDNVIDRIGAAEKMVDRYRGYDAIIKVKNVGKSFNGKSNGEIDFQFDAFGERKPILPGRPAEEIDALINTVKDLSTIVTIPTYEQTQTAVGEYLKWFDNKMNTAKGE